MHKFPMRWLVGALSIVALLLLLSGPVLAVSISIINHSFEDVSGDGLGGWSSYTIDESNRGIVASETLYGYPDYTSPDGGKAAYVKFGGDLYQRVGAIVPITSNTTYILKVYVGHPGLRNPAPEPGGPPPDPLFGYSVQLRSWGTTNDVLASSSSYGYDPGKSYFGMVTLSYTGEQNHINQFLEIALMANQNSFIVNFDNVTLDAVPVPPTVWLLGSGLLGLAGWRKLRKG